MSTLRHKIQQAVSDYKSDPANKGKKTEELSVDYQRIMDGVMSAHEAELKQRFGHFYGFYNRIRRAVNRVKRFIKNMNCCFFRVTIVINRH